MTRQSGFTLIEVLLAMAITAIAAIMAYSSLDSSIRLAEQAEIEADRVQRVNRVFDVLAKDFRQISPRVVRSPDGMGFIDAFYFNETSYPMLRLSRSGWSNPMAERFQRSQLQRVNYHYDGDKLIRQSWQMMDRYDDSEAMEFTLLEGVKRFSIRLLMIKSVDDGSGELKNDSEWVSEWPQAEPDSVSVSGSSKLPAAVELNMEVEGWGNIRRVFELVESEA